MENGNRVYDIGLNPHSNGVDFCLSKIVFFLIITINIDIKVVRIVVVMIEIIINLISYFYLLKPLSWKLNILFILNKNYFYPPHQYTDIYKNNHTTSTKCQYHADASNPT